MTNEILTPATVGKLHGIKATTMSYRAKHTALGAVATIGDTEYQRAEQINGKPGWVKMNGMPFAAPADEAELIVPDARKVSAGKKAKAFRRKDAGDQDQVDSGDQDQVDSGDQDQVDSAPESPTSGSNPEGNTEHPPEEANPSASPGASFTLMRNIAGGDDPGKAYWLDDDGVLCKEVHGSRLRFRAERHTMNLEALADLIKNAECDTHIVTGTAEHAEAVAVASSVLISLDRAGTTDIDGAPPVGLGDQHIQHRAGDEGLLVIDSDGVTDDVPVWGCLVSACPVLAAHAHVEASSSGAYIYRQADGEMLRGLTGQHTFFHVADAADIPRALTVLHKRLWLAGHGRIVLTAAGAMLERSPVDLQLRVPSQPVFLHSTMGAGLEQRKSTEYFPGREVLDTKAALPDLTPAQEADYVLLVADAKRMMVPEAVKVRSEYARKRMDEMRERNPALTAAEVEARALLGLTGRLPDEWLITLSDGTLVTVADILAGPTAYHEVTCRDPLEPKYGSRSVAKIYSDQARPAINSNAHGGQVFYLGTPPDINEIFPPFGEWQKEQEAEMFADIDRDAGDPVLLGWLGAVVVAGRQKALVPAGAAGITADALGTAWLKHTLGLPDAILPEALKDAEFPPAEYGLSLVYRIGGKAACLKLSSSAMEDALEAWAEFDKDAALRGWAGLIARHCAIPGSDDPVAAVLAGFASRLLKLPLKAAREALLGEPKEGIAGAIGVFLSSMASLERKARPAPPVSEAVAPDPAEVEAEAARSRLAEEAALREVAKPLLESRDIFADAYVVAVKHAGVVGERDIFYASLAAALSAGFKRKSLIISLVVTGPTASGKSYTSQAAIKLLPAERTVVRTSMSDKDLFHMSEDALSGKAFVLFEANALSDPDRPLTMALRTLLTEGSIKYSYVEDVKCPDGTTKKESVFKEVNGPTSLITTTTKLGLDPEMETRALFLETDDSSAQTKGIVGNRKDDIIKGEAEDPQYPPEYLAQWEAFLRWLEYQPKKVAIPFWGDVVERTHTGMVRMRRDITRVIALIRIHAMLHQCHRTINEDGAIEANLDDYDFARRLVLPTLTREMGCSGASDGGVIDLVAGIKALIDKQKSTGVPYNAAKLEPGEIRTPDFPPHSLDELRISYRQLARELKLHLAMVQRRMTKAYKAGNIENRETIPRHPMRLVLLDETSTPQLLPDVAQLSMLG